MRSRQDLDGILIVFWYLNMWAIEEQYRKGKYIDFYCKYSKSNVDLYTIGLPIAWQ